MKYHKYGIRTDADFSLKNVSLKTACGRKFESCHKLNKKDRFSVFFIFDILQKIDISGIYSEWIFFSEFIFKIAAANQHQYPMYTFALLL